MGLGRYVDGAYHLVVSFVGSQPPSARDLERWRYAFRVASNLLERATFGQLRLGRVTFAPDALATRSADAFVFTDRVGTGASPAEALGVPGFPMRLDAGALRRPMLIVHEFGHYALGLPDEYGEVRNCIVPARGVCIMAAVGDTKELRHATLDVPPGQRLDRPPVDHGRIACFCSPTDHVLERADGTDVSCWSRITARFPGLVPPHGFEAPAVRPLPWRAIEFCTATPEQRICIGIDVSSDDLSYAAGVGLRGGVDLLATLAAELPGKVQLSFLWNGVLTTSPKEARLGSLDEGPGLADTLARVQARLTEGAVSDQIPAVRGLILISDARTRGEDARLAVESDRCAAAGIRILALGPLEGMDHAGLRVLAERTGGHAERLENEPDQADVLLNTGDFLLRAFCDLYQHAGMVGYRRCVLPALGPHPVAPHPVDQHSGRKPNAEWCDVDFVVDAGVSELTVVVLSRHAAGLTLAIVDPLAHPLTLIRGQGYLVARVKGLPADRPTVTVRVARLAPGAAAGVAARCQGPIELIVAGIVVNSDVHTAVRVVRTGDSERLWIKALRLADLASRPPLVTGRGRGRSRGVLPPVRPLVAVAMRSVVGRAFVPGTRQLLARSQPDAAPELWLRPYPFFASDLATLAPGRYMTNVEVLSRAEGQRFLRVHRLQLWVGAAPGVVPAQVRATPAPPAAPPAPPASSEPPAATAPAARPRRRARAARRR